MQTDKFLTQILKKHNAFFFSPKKSNKRFPICFSMIKNAYKMFVCKPKGKKTTQETSAKTAN
jgi:hypothetical protein